MLRKLAALAITFWVGSLWMTSLSASILFQKISDRTLAGNVAGHLFTTVSYIGLACGVLLLIERFSQFHYAVGTQSYFWVVVVMLVLTLIGLFIIQPVLAQIKVDALPSAVMNSIHAGRFAAWHGVAGAVYLFQCLLGAALVLKAIKA